MQSEESTIILYIWIAISLKVVIKNQNLLEAFDIDKPPNYQIILHNH